jgi:hypothetical protein
MLAGLILLYYHLLTLATNYIFEPILGITFDSENEGYEFYNMYSWEVGFGIKKATRVTNKKGFHTMRDMSCLCSVSLLLSNFFSR